MGVEGWVLVLTTFAVGLGLGWFFGSRNERKRWIGKYVVGVYW